MEAAEKISVGVIKEKTKSKAVKKEAEGMRVSTREKSVTELVISEQTLCGQR